MVKTSSRREGTAEEKKGVSNIATTVVREEKGRGATSHDFERKRRGSAANCFDRLVVEGGTGSREKLGRSELGDWGLVRGQNLRIIARRKKGNVTFCNPKGGRKSVSSQDSDVFNISKRKGTREFVCNGFKEEGRASLGTLFWGEASGGWLGLRTQIKHVQKRKKILGSKNAGREKLGLKVTDNGSRGLPGNNYRVNCRYHEMGG